MEITQRRRMQHLLVMTVAAISFASLCPRKSPIKENILNALIAGAFKRLSLSTRGGRVFRIHDGEKSTLNFHLGNTSSAISDLTFALSRNAT
jgi:hypothetical protein